MIKRIEKLERHIPKNEPKEKSIFCLHGAHPSQEEQEIAFRKAEELSKEKHFMTFFIPYDCENAIPSLRFGDTIVEKNENLGIIITEQTVYKLVENYYSDSCYHEKDCPVITGEKTSALGEKPLSNNCNVT